MIGKEDCEEENSKILKESSKEANLAPQVSMEGKVVPPPFPQRLVSNKKEKQFHDIFKTLRKVEINIPLLDAIK